MVSCKIWLRCIVGFVNNDQLFVSASCPWHILNCMPCWCISYAYILQVHWYSKQVWPYANRSQDHYLPSLEHQVPNHSKSNGKSQTRKVLPSICLDLPHESSMKSLCPVNGHRSWGLINTTHISHHNKPMASLHVIKSQQFVTNHGEITSQNSKF